MSPGGQRASGSVGEWQGASQAPHAVPEGCGGGHGSCSLPSGPSQGLLISQQVAADSIC